MSRFFTRDPMIEHAKQIIFADYGDKVSLEAKNKDLLKFGRNADVETSIATIMTLPDGVDNETYVASDLITSIISDSVSDGEAVVVEGHTLSGGNFTFLTQVATLNGTTVVPLSTALARVSRVYNNDSTDLTGNIYVTEDDTYSSGVPVTDSKVHLILRAGHNQSEKASTTISSVDYWVITSFGADMYTKAASFGEVNLEIRLSGKTFRQVEDVTCSDAHQGIFNFRPYLIIPPNSDVRLRGMSDSASGRDIGGHIEGFLLKA